jgi:hypothetical protein
LIDEHISPTSLIKRIFVLEIVKIKKHPSNGIIKRLDKEKCKLLKNKIRKLNPKKDKQKW